MSEYKGIKGFQVQTRAEDPSEGIIGDFYYNSTSGDFKTISNGSAAWASGGNLNTGRGNGAPAISGTQNAALFAAGYSTTVVGNTESYNGTSWSEVNDVNNNRYQLAGAGTYTAALAFGGTPGHADGHTETWDGSSWTEVNNLNTGRYGLGGIGTQTAALATGGNPGPAQLASNESWDGTNWTEVGDLNTARGEDPMTGGTQTAGIFAFGQINPGTPNNKTGKTEIWDGSSWTEVGDGNTGRANLSGSGTTTAALAFAGLIPPATAVTEEWNGTSWTETADLSTARDALSGNGTTSSALAFGGNTSPKQQTEEWTQTFFTIKTVTTS